MVHIYHTVCPDKLPSTLDLSFLSTAYQRQLESFVMEDDKLSYYYSKRMLCNILEAHHGITDLLGVKLYDKGKPYIEGLPQFNISHSGRHLLVALSSDMHIHIGIDIQMHKKLDKTLFQKYYNPLEWEKVQDDESTFYDIWTIKESAIKADGRGMSILSSTGIDSENRVQADNSLLYFYLLNNQLRTDNVSAALVTNHAVQIQWHELPLR